MISEHALSCSFLCTQELGAKISLLLLLMKKFDAKALQGESERSDESEKKVVLFPPNVSFFHSPSLSPSSRLL